MITKSRKKPAYQVIVTIIVGISINFALFRSLHLYVDKFSAKLRLIEILSLKKSLRKNR